MTRLTVRQMAARCSGWLGESKSSVVRCPRELLRVRHQAVLGLRSTVHPTFPLKPDPSGVSSRFLVSCLKAVLQCCCPAVLELRGMVQQMFLPSLDQLGKRSLPLVCCPGELLRWRRYR